ncbi:MAG: hypothetical protein HXS44_07305 [Theionarchaea archaeon]|nr:hypothetical protein [Theionarchaea archaeon]
MKICARNVKASIASARRAARDGVKRSTCDVMRRISPFEDYASTMTQSVEVESSVPQILVFLQGESSQGCGISDWNIPFPDKKHYLVKEAAENNHEAFAFIGLSRRRCS